MYNLSIYGGAGDGADGDDGAKVDYVTRLLEPELDGNAHVLVTDNYYSSEKLALALNERGIGFVGTLTAKASSFAGFEKPEVGTTKDGQTKYGPAVAPGEYRTAQRKLATIQGTNQSTPASRRASSSSTPCTQPLSDTLTVTSWSDSSKTNPVTLIANFGEQEHDMCLRQPKKATEENPECAKEERECPWLAKLYGMYYGGVDTADKDINYLLTL